MKKNDFILTRNKQGIESAKIRAGAAGDIRGNPRAKALRWASRSAALRDVEIERGLPRMSPAAPARIFADSMVMN